MGKKINLLAIQIESEIANIDKNIKKVKTLLEKELLDKVIDFVILPEVWTCGWECSEFINCAESLENSESVNMLKNIAKIYNVNIIGGSFIQKKTNGKFYNTCPVIDRKGELVCTYEKNHLFSYYGCNEGEFITKGENPVMVELNGIKIGLTICYDIRFPEIFRAYRKAGADILVNMAAWGANKRNQWDSMSKSRAIENQSYYVALTQTGMLNDGIGNLGHSMILDYKGDILSEIEKVEGGIFASCDLDDMYNFREKCTILDDIKNSYEVKKI